MSQETRTRIMDAAERMFAERGYDAVPVREIMLGANAKLGLLGYHFGTKEALFEAVLARRIDVLNNARRDRLAALAGSEGSSVEAVVEAFVAPYRDLMVAHDAGWLDYGRLVAQIAQMRRWSELVQKYLNPTALLFLDELQRLAPSASQHSIVRAFTFMVGAMLNAFATTDRMTLLTDGKVRDDQFEDIYQDLVPFLAGGIRSIVVLNREMTPVSSPE